MIKICNFRNFFTIFLKISEIFKSAPHNRHLEAHFGVLADFACPPLKWYRVKIFSHVERNATPRTIFRSDPPPLIFEMKIRACSRQPRQRDNGVSKRCDGFGPFWTVLEPSKRRKLRCYWKTGAFKTRPNPSQRFVDALRIRHFLKSGNSGKCKKNRPRAWNLTFCENRVDQK